MSSTALGILVIELQFAGIAGVFFFRFLERRYHITAVPFYMKR
jgi:hypothetical protein